LRDTTRARQGKSAKREWSAKCALSIRSCGGDFVGLR
jgi:hypothetical protein